jgi:hypothetical protein
VPAPWRIRKRTQPECAHDFSVNTGDQTIDPFGWLCESLPPLFDGGKRNLECAPNRFGTGEDFSDGFSVAWLGAADGDVNDYPPLAVCRREALIDLSVIESGL